MRSQVRTYDIFSGTQNTDPEWIGSVIGYEAAYERVQAMSTDKPGSYFILCSSTNRIVYAVNTTMREVKPS